MYKMNVSSPLAQALSTSAAYAVTVLPSVHTQEPSRQSMNALWPSVAAVVITPVAYVMTASSFAGASLGRRKTVNSLPLAVVATTPVAFGTTVPPSVGLVINGVREVVGKMQVRQILRQMRYSQC